MDNKPREGVESLRKDIGKILRNRLVFPKTVMGLLRDGKATKDQILRMQDDLDEAIRMVDSKFAEFLDGLGKG